MVHTTSKRGVSGLVGNGRKPYSSRQCEADMNDSAQIQVLELKANY